MALFRRRSTSDEEPIDDLAGGPELDLADEEAGVDPGDDAPGARPSGVDERSGGPFDEADAELADQSLPRLDLGSLLVPGLPGIGVQVEADPNTQEVRAITAVGQEAAVQVQAFAAPRSEGIWDDIRAEMLSELSATAGATVTEHDGPFGPELRAVIPARSPEGAQVMQPLRFTGIDGPRWFLRAVFLGRAAVEPDPEDDLHRVVRELIVVRGPEARAPRDPLPLRLPEQPPEGMATEGEATEAPGAGDDDIDPDDGPGSRYADIDPFERGPEITEVR